MVGLNTDGPTRDQVLKLMEEKERIEHEIQELTLVLETNGNVGMTDPLVDQDGYPRNDIDVYLVRHARHRIICLQNDHKEIMKHIERGIHTVHAELLQRPYGEGPSGSRSIVEPMETTASLRNGFSRNGHIPNGHIPLDIHNGYVPNGHVPNGHANGHHDPEDRVAMVVAATSNLQVEDRAFVKVNFVSPGSPADVAGIQEDDEVLRFGSINSTNYHSLTQIGELVQHSIGTRVDIQVRRGINILNVTLVPNTWAGRGLLGCNIVPV